MKKRKRHHGDKRHKRNLTARKNLAGSSGKRGRRTFRKKKQRMSGKKPF